MAPFLYYYSSIIIFCFIWILQDFWGAMEAKMIAQMNVSTGNYCYFEVFFKNYKYKVYSWFPSQFACIVSDSNPHSICQSVLQSLY